jgi:peroxiredoxin
MVPTVIDKADSSLSLFRGGYVNIEATHPSESRARGGEGRWRLTEVGMVALLLLLVITVALLVQQVSHLRPRAEELQRRKTLPYIGQVVPIVWGVTPAGDSIEIGQPPLGTSQVLVFFATSCPYCAETLPRWKELANALAQDSLGRLAIVGVSVSPPDSTRAYVAEHQVPYPVVRITDSRLRRLFRVKGVPMTLVIDPRGQVAHVHPSVIRSQTQLDSIVSIARLVARVSAPAVGEP